MSWDIYIMKFPASIKKVADVPDDFQGKPLGKRSEIIAQICAVVLDADFSNPEWGDLDGNGFSIEFNMGSSEITDSILLHVRGGGNPTPVIAAVLDRLQLRAIDCQAGEFFDIATARASFDSWQRYRDQIVGRAPPKLGTKG